MANKESENTKEKIKLAAKKVFMQKGFAATRTRDISKASGINLALINYHFKSKENLFRIIMHESVNHFGSTLLPILDNEKTTLEEKVNLLVDSYLDLLVDEPNLAMFILNEVNNHTESLIARLDIKNTFHNTAFMEQLVKQNPNIHPIQILLNISGLVVFPFLVKPILKELTQKTEEEFKVHILNRKELIKSWLHKIIFN